VEDWDVISSYSTQQAIEDGIKIDLGPRLFATTNLCRTLAPTDEVFSDDGTPMEWDAHVLDRYITPILDRYNSGDYGMGDVDAFFAIYETNGHIVWAILDYDGLTLLLPEDY